MPIRVIAKELVERGYGVTIVCASHWRKAIEDIGCDFVAIKGVRKFRNHSSRSSQKYRSTQDHVLRLESSVAFKTFESSPIAFLN